MVENDRHKRKFKDFIYKTAIDINSPQILEFGVSERGMSTELFLEICHKNNGYMISVDANDNVKKFDSNKWKFVNCRDDNFDQVKNIIGEKIFDIIYLDTTHKANHVHKILFFYYDFLKPKGYFFIDDTSWFTYTKNREKNNFSIEINNYETFEKLTEIHSNNHQNFDLEFSFVGTGVAKLKKLNDNKLNPHIKTLSRINSFKNLFRKFVLKIKNFFINQ